MRPPSKKHTREKAQTSPLVPTIESRFAQCERVGHVGSWEWTIADGGKWWSDEMYRIFGYEPKSFTPTLESFRRLVHPDDVDALFGGITKIFDDRQSQEFEHRIIRPDGQVRILRGRCDAVIDAQGTIIRLVGFTQDVTDRRAAEEILQRSQRRLRTMIDAEPACVKLVSCAGLLLDMNPAGLKMIGAETLSQVVGQNITDLVHPDDRGKFRDAHEAVCRGESQRLEFRVVGFNGTVVWVDSHMVAFDATDHGDQGERAVLSVTSDITERKRLEEQLRQSQKMEAIGRLAGEVAHDFNNLLTVIGGLSQSVLEDLGEGHQASNDLQAIVKTAESAAALTRQLLLFSRKHVVQMTAIDLNTVIADLDPMLRRTIGEDILVNMEPAASLRPISGDGTQLQQIMMNLAVNARDAMPDGGVLTIRTANVDLDPLSAGRVGLPEGRYVSLTVADTGIGMNAETKAHIFEPFFTTKERGQGTGLGLAVVYGIVQNLGGAIVVESDLRHGTIFTVLLPESEVKAEARPEERLPRVVDLAGHETVLVVEDDNRVREYTARVLRKSGYEVIEASNPAQALALSKQDTEHLDALVTDIVMPGIDGFELAERLRSENSGLGVLYMSGYPKESMRRRGLRIDQRRLLEKPFSATHLLRRVREVLDARQ
jgi:two-component system cell cycle sensor histidine kinase/response regulator CckA